MTPQEIAQESAAAVHDLPAAFMLDGATYVRGGELGYDGIDFYLAGRGGALGEVDADVAAAAFVFFNPDEVRRGWTASRGVQTRREAAESFAGCCHEWARAHLTDDVDWARLADLTGKVVTAASPAGAPIFAGWRQLPEPADAKPLALGRLNALRELRAACHGAAVLAAGLTPVEAMAVKSPGMAQLFGWSELPDPGPVTERWNRAESHTNEAFGRALGALDDAERSEWLALATAAARAQA